MLTTPTVIVWMGFRLKGVKTFPGTQENHEEQEEPVYQKERSETPKIRKGPKSTEG